MKTDEPICPEGKLSCGNGECIEKELFCNDKPDCKDESDENACSKYSYTHPYIFYPLNDTTLLYQDWHMMIKVFRWVLVREGI